MGSISLKTCLQQIEEAKRETDLRVKMDVATSTRFVRLGRRAYCIAGMMRSGGGRWRTLFMTFELFCLKLKFEIDT